MQQWKIRILSGVHAGVEVTLPNDSLVLGSDDFTADLVLTDSDIKVSHLVLVCDGDTVLMRDCEDASVNNKSVTVGPDGVELSRNDLVSVGRLLFAVGHLDDDLVVDVATEVADKQALPVNHKPSSGWMRTLLTGLFFSLIPSVIFAGVWYSQIRENESDTITQAEPIVLVRNILSELTLNDVRVEWNATALQAVLDGYVEDSIEKLVLSQIFRKLVLLPFYYLYLH